MTFYVLIRIFSLALREIALIRLAASLYINTYSPFHSSMPLQQLGQSSFCVNQVFFFYSILELIELKQYPRCQMVFKSIQQSSLGYAVTSPDKTL